jgi:hypothetical protein
MRGSIAAQALPQIKHARALHAHVGVHVYGAPVCVPACSCACVYGTHPGGEHAVGFVHEAGRVVVAQLVRRNVRRALEAAWRKGGRRYSFAMLYTVPQSSRGILPHRGNHDS